MSLQGTQTISCPACKLPFSVTGWSSVNVSVDPALKKRVLDRSLFTAKCPRCSHITTLEHDCLYHDMHRKAAVWLKFPDSSGVMTMDSLPLNVFGSAISDYQLRLVTSYPTLLEKIHCIDHQLDDRVVEFVKAGVFARLYNVALEHDTPFYFAGIRKRLLRPAVMDFVDLTSEDGSICDIPFSASYGTAVRSVQSLDPMPAPTGQWLHINQTYIEHLDAKSRA